MQVLEPFVAYHVPYISDESRKEILKNWHQALTTLDKRAVMQMPNLHDFDDAFKPLS
jgi:NAD(P)H dehydrogenase (quinone)